jgi:hypothetical protein
MTNRIEEISKITKLNYISKAAKDIGTKALAARQAYDSGDFKSGDNALDKKVNRQLGINKAAARLAYESNISPDAPEDEKNANETGEVEVSGSQDKSKKKPKKKSAEDANMSATTNDTSTQPASEQVQRLSNIVLQELSKSS